MIFAEPLQMGVMLKRYKRFLVDVELEGGARVTVHCPNTGRMTSCTGVGWPVALSESRNLKRKYRYTLEMVHNARCWIGVNTARANAIVAEAITAGSIKELAGYPELTRERPYGDGCRIDLLLRSGLEICYVEVKNTTLVDGDGYYSFPDAVTARGKRHLEALSAVCRTGHRGVVIYLVQRSDGEKFRPARSIDPLYADAVLSALEAGVEMLVFRAEVSPQGIQVVEPVQMEFE